MRIAMVGDEFYPAMGGAPTYTVDLGKALSELGAEPIVLTHSCPGYPREEEFDGLKVKRLAGFVMSRVNRAASAGLIRRLYENIKLGGFDVVHGQDIYSPMALASVFSAHKRKIPSVLTCHSVHKAGKIWQLIYQPVVSGMKRADRVIAVSGAAKVYCVALGAPQNKIEIIPNGVDLSIFNTKVDGSAMRAKLGIVHEPLVVTAIRFVKRKGSGYLVSAFSKVLESMPNAKLAIAGSGPEAENLRVQIRKLGIERSVKILIGLKREEVAELMAVADVFVLPSLVESFGIVLLEAMAVGTPIVCTRTQGATEIVEDGVNGIMVQPADSDALADAILRVLNDSQLARGLRKNGLKVVQNRFSWKKTAKMTLALYEKVCEEYAKCSPHN
jgi:glycogen(starch) synthase